MFPGGERRGYLEKTGSTGGDKKKKKKNVKLTPAGQDVYGGCMRGHVQS